MQVRGELIRPEHDGFRVIETFGWDGARFPRLARHLARLGRTCGMLAIPFEPMEVLVRLDALPDLAPLRVRVTVDRAGQVAVGHVIAAAGPAVWRVRLAAERVTSADPWLRVKTSERGLYDRARAGLTGGLDEVIFANERGEMCEGSITSVFFDAGAGLCTPPVACGLLPGILREEMLEAGRCREAVLPVSDLARVRLWVGNSLRGMIPAALEG